MRDSDESYVIGLCDKILNRRASRQHRFNFLRGDPGKNGSCATLPVDAYYSDRKLVIEYWERQHLHPMPFMDKRMTCSGCTRGEQRKVYDRRKRQIVERNGITVVVLRYEQLDHNARGRLKRNRKADEPFITGVLKEFAM